MQVHSLENQRKGQDAKRIPYPVLDLAVDGSSSAVRGHQLPEKSASMNSFMNLSLQGSKIKP
eukprot:13295232-Ditylum_brightwellii.AAC.1